MLDREESDNEEELDELEDDDIISQINESEKNIVIGKIKSFKY